MRVVRAAGAKIHQEQAVDPLGRRELVPLALGCSQQQLELRGRPVSTQDLLPTSSAFAIISLRGDGTCVCPGTCTPYEQMQWLLGRVRNPVLSPCGQVQEIVLFHRRLLRSVTQCAAAGQYEEDSSTSAWLTISEVPPGSTFSSPKRSTPLTVAASASPTPNRGV